MAIVDFHNHLLPGVDDGAQDLADSEDAVAAFVNDGVTTIVVTPHVDGGLTLQPKLLNERLAELDAAWLALQRMTAAKFPQVVLHRAVELLLDVPEPDLSDPRLRLAGGTFFLMEFPYMMVPPQSARVIQLLKATGYTPIIAHPERYQNTNLELAAEWRDAGALLQINGGSLLGRYGAEPKKHAFHLLERGWADYLCSDYHARGAPMVREYEQLLVSHDAEDQAHTLMRTNPARMLNSERPLPVSPIRIGSASLWSRMGALFR